MNAKLTSLMLAASLALPISAHAEAASTVSKKEQHFVDALTEGGMAEIQTSQLALKTSQNSDIKTFAQKMVDDHTKAGDALTQIATKDGISTPTTLSKHHQATLDKLSKLTGAKFDAAYIKAMASDHDGALKALNKEIATGKDQDIVGWAKAALPTVQDHDNMAHQLETSTSKSM